MSSNDHLSLANVPHLSPPFFGTDGLVNWPAAMPTARRLGAEDLYPRICVRDPYFALQNVMALGRGEVVADIPVEQDPGAESSPIAIAEAGRHLAILGTCAAATAADDPGQHYYLATSAKGEWVGEAPTGGRASMLRAAAAATFAGPRRATARTLLLGSDAAPLFSLQVDYNVMRAESFAKVFAHARVELRSQSRAVSDVAGRAQRTNPYARPLTLEDLRIREASAEANVAVTAEMCKGHFAMYPMMPVAVVAGGMCRLAGQLVSNGDPSIRYFTRWVSLQAENLAMAGRTLRLTAERLRASGGDQTILCRAATNEVSIASLEIVLARTA